jgi:uncharacterized protein
MRVGLISDTHGLLRPEAVAFLRGSDRIIHAGDIGKAEILAELGHIAPVTAVRGNNDREGWTEEIDETAWVRIGEVTIYVIHDLGELDIDAASAGIQIVVAGHSHRPLIERREGVLFVNPGSAGPRRFRLPVTAGELVVRGAAAAPRIVEILT